MRVSQHVVFNQVLKLMEVPEGKWTRLRRTVLEGQDTVVRTYFAQKYWKTTVCGDEESRAAGSRGLAHLGLDMYA